MRSWKAVVFDLDGTLIHSVPSLRAALNDVLAEDGLSPLTETEVAGMVGRGAAHLVAAAYACRIHDMAGPTERDARLSRFLARYDRDPLTGTVAYPGVPALLSALRAADVAVGVCTNKPERPARALCEALGLAPCLGALTGGDTLPERKPHPAPLNHTLKQLSVTPEETLYIGDSITDVTCARRAGTRIYLVAHGYTTVPATQLGGDRVFVDIIDLHRHLFPPQ